MGVIPSRQEAAFVFIWHPLGGMSFGVAALECGMTNDDCFAAPRPKTQCVSPDMLGRWATQRKLLSHVENGTSLAVWRCLCKACDFRDSRPFLPLTLFHIDCLCDLSEVCVRGGVIWKISTQQKKSVPSS